MTKPRRELCIPYIDDDSPERRVFWMRHGMTAEQAARPAETLFGVRIEEKSVPPRRGRGQPKSAKRKA